MFAQLLDMCVPPNGRLSSSLVVFLCFQQLDLHIRHLVYSLLIKGSIAHNQTLVSYACYINSQSNYPLSTSYTPYPSVFHTI